MSTPSLFRYSVLLVHFLRFDASFISPNYTLNPWFSHGLLCIVLSVAQVRHRIQLVSKRSDDQGVRHFFCIVSFHFLHGLLGCKLPHLQMRKLQ